MNTRRYLVSGRVQGVGFRFFVVRAAESIGLCGTVRNLEDGSVEVVAQGTPDQLVRLESFLHHGPRHAIVESVVGSAPLDLPRFSSFDVTD